MPKKKAVRYRKPRVYIPPYNYCDRWCARCRIDKERCLLYQTEMDDALHREIDGRGEPTADETVERMREDARHAIRLLEDQAKEMGVDLGKATEIPAVPSPPPAPDPLAEEASILARATAAFLRAHGASFPGEAETLRKTFHLPGPKIGRAAYPATGSLEEADRILQAQVAHRAMEEMTRALQAIRRQDAGRGDAMIEILALLKTLREEVERRWLLLPNEHLVPVEGRQWWGPLRDITPTLKNFRR